MLEARPGKSGAERFARPTVVTLLAVINLLSGIAWLAVAVTDFVSHWTWPQADSESFFMVMVSVALAGLMVVCGYGLWTLKSYGRTILLVLCCVGVFFFPLGTFASLWIAVYFFQRPIRVLFSGRSPDDLSTAEQQSLRLRPAKGMSWRTAMGAVLGILFLVGALSAMAIPGLRTAIEVGKQKRSVKTLKSIGSALERYHDEHDSYPLAGDVRELAMQIEPDYLPSMPTVDAWGNPLLVASDSTGYAIRSVGSDGVAQDGTAEGPIGFESDIVFSNGGFTQWPQGLSPEVTEAL